MYQTDNIEDIARDLGIDSGTSSSSADRLRKIADQVGMNNYNSLYDNDKLEQRLRDLKRQQNPNIDARGNTASTNNPNKKFNSDLARNKLNSKKNSMLNKIAEKGLQSAGLSKGLSNKLVNSGLVEDAVGKAKKRNPLFSTLDRLSSRSEEESSSEGFGDFISSIKVVKYAMIGLICLMPILIFFVTITTTIDAYRVAINLGNADALADPSNEEKINKKMDTTPDVEDPDDEEVGYDFFIDNDFRNNKLNETNLIQIAYRRKYNESTLNDLEDFYPNVDELGKKYDERLVYDFFYKMFNLYRSYDNRIDYPRDPEDNTPLIDLPLLMATLSLESENMSIVFESNLDSDDREDWPRRQPVDEYSYDYDWSDYTISGYRSTHDMEILAQHMLSKQVKETCVDSSGNITKTNILKDDEIESRVLTCDSGETYKVSDVFYAHDDDKYKEFLKEFLEKKYYVNNRSNNLQNAGAWREWKQCGESWSDLIVPKSKKTMCQIGCLITSVSIQIARSETLLKVDSFDPSVALTKFKFVNGGNFVWKSTTEVAPNFKYKTHISLVGLTKAGILRKLSSYSASKYYIILAVSRKDENKIHHYVALDYVDYNTGEIYMIDPASDVTNVFDIYKIYQFHVYEKKD